MEYNGRLLNEIKQQEQDIKNDHYYFDKHFNTWINKQLSCDIGGDNVHRFNFFNPSGPNLTEQFAINLAQNPNIKWQYFMSFLGIHIEYPSYYPPNNYCFLRYLINKYSTNHNSENESFKNIPIGKRFIKTRKPELYYHQKKAYNELSQLLVQRHRENLFTTALVRPKLVVIVIDRGSSLSNHQLTIGKSIAKYILNSLSHRDKVAIIDLTSTVNYPSNEACSNKIPLAYANYETKHYFSIYIDELERSLNSTNHYLGFQTAFEFISVNYDSFKKEMATEPEILIPYISRGLLSSLADAKPVMQLIANELKNRSYSFVINTYALIDDRMPIMWETTFLKEIANMNFKKFNIELPIDNQIKVKKKRFK